jgi:hypothetical protein
MVASSAVDDGGELIASIRNTQRISSGHFSSVHVSTMVYKEDPQCPALTLRLSTPRFEWLEVAAGTSAHAVVPLRFRSLASESVVPGPVARARGGGGV